MPSRHDVLALTEGRGPDAGESAPLPSDEHGPPPTIDAASRTILIRIQRSSDQLKTVAKALSNLANEHVGLTREQLMELESMGRKAPGAPAELLTRIRKAWDIGADRIVLQTVVQLDGDIIFRARRDALIGANQIFAQAHERATSTALDHWQNLFNLITGLLIRRTGRVLERD